MTLGWLAGLGILLLAGNGSPQGPSLSLQAQGLVLEGPRVFSLEDSLPAWQTLLRTGPLPTTLETLQERIRRCLANQGFPEAWVRPWYFTGPPDSLVVHLWIHPGPLRRLQVLVSRPPGVSLAPLRRWFQPALQHPYSHQRLIALQIGWNHRFGHRLWIDSVQFHPPETLVLFVKQRPANRMEGVLSYSQEGHILGNLTLDFQNLAGTLRALHLSWTRWRAAEQEAWVAYEEPWIPHAWIRLEGHLYLHDTLSQVLEGAWVLAPMALRDRWGLGMVFHRSLWIPTQEWHRETRSLLVAERYRLRGITWRLRLEGTRQFLRYLGHLRLTLGPTRGPLGGGEVLAAGVERSPHLLPGDLLDFPLLWLPFASHRFPRDFQRLLGLRLFVGLGAGDTEVRGLLEQSHSWLRDSTQALHRWGTGIEIRWRTSTGLHAHLQYTWTPGRSLGEGVLRVLMGQWF